ncbi:MAG: isochorismatase family cysteine hydrolase [Gammaproteobacteria bacterium]|jgi:ureidoacrylate peracid hydrolase|nr:isochorismatase family cysteine hydrolase [Gammaproteobacteria bacterium]|tara:strand:- start:641 stop:1354 length:714 start_codon:yes stop_codon:yes gene_type:complete
MHKIIIPENVIDSCIALRGDTQVFSSIEPERSALVVIDMQNAWVEPDLSAVEIPESRSIVDNINRLARATRAAGGIVAWTQSTFPADWTHRMYEHFAPKEWRDRVISETAIGSHGHNLSDRMDVAADDIKVVKTRPSAFIQGSSILEKLLRERNRDTLIITGTLTNACCESSIRDAMALGFHNIIVSDGTATRTDIEHNATLTNLFSFLAGVMTTNEVLARLGSKNNSMASEFDSES